MRENHVFESLWNGKNFFATHCNSELRGIFCVWQLPHSDGRFRPALICQSKMRKHMQGSWASNP